MPIYDITPLRFGTIVLVLAITIRNTTFALGSSKMIPVGAVPINRRDQVIDGRVCLVEPNRQRCPVLSSVPGSLQTITQARAMPLPECNENDAMSGGRVGGPLIGSSISDWAFKRKNEMSSISYVFALPDPIRGDVSLVLNETYAILRNNLVGSPVSEFDFFSLPTYTTSSASTATIDLNFHVINTDVTDITTNPMISADCIITFKIDGDDSWETTLVDMDTPISSLESSSITSSTGVSCPAGATTLRDFGPEWSFYSAHLGAGCAFAVDLTVKDGSATIDNIAVSTGGWTTVYDFEL